MKQGDCYYCFYRGMPEDSPICVECGIARKNYTPRKGGCGLCPYDEDGCYELRKHGSCFYDGVFTEIEYEKCKFRLAPTNYDRLTKSVDALAKFLFDHGECSELHCPARREYIREDGCHDACFMTEENCLAAWTDWLKKEVE